MHHFERPIQLAVADGRVVAGAHGAVTEMDDTRQFDDAGVQHPFILKFRCRCLKDNPFFEDCYHCYLALLRTCRDY